MTVVTFKPSEKVPKAGSGKCKTTVCPAVINPNFITVCCPATRKHHLVHIAQQSVSGASSERASKRSVVKVAIPHCRGK